MAESRSIAQLGHPILRQIAQPIQNFEHPRLQRLIEDLLGIAQSSNGVGIAAPQVSESLRLFIVASRPNPRYPTAPAMTPTAMLNPRLIAFSPSRVKGWEGCLSVPDKRGLVPRYQEIEVEYFDRLGNLQRRVLTDFVARIFQHELDHLDGKVFLDRLESSEDLYTEEEYLALIAIK
jgi:peptide deformylase